MITKLPHLVRAFDNIMRYSPSLNANRRSKFVYDCQDIFQQFYRNAPKLSLSIDYEAYIMAKFTWNFASVRLQKSDVQEIENFAESLEDDLSMLFDIFADDFVKISANYSEKQSAWCVTLTPQEGNEYNAEVSMTTWSNSVVEAFWMAGYKHVIICGRKTYPTKTEQWG